MLTVIALALVAAPTAGAAEPASGAISPAAPYISWTGTATGFGVNIVNNNSTSLGGPFVCEAPFCDTFTLDFQATDTLTVIAKATTGTAFTEVMITAPDGSTFYSYGNQESPETQVSIPAQPGAYEIGISCGVCIQEAIPGGYKASARVGTPAPKPKPKPDPAPAPSPAPAQPAPAEPAPAQPAPAVEPTLHVITAKASARKVRRRLLVSLRASSPLTGLTATLFRGRKAVATAKLARLSGSGRLAFGLRRALKPGRYEIRVAGTSASGTLVGARAQLRVVR
jgi:hypothetical protein